MALLKVGDQRALSGELSSRRTSPSEWTCWSTVGQVIYEEMEPEDAWYVLETSDTVRKFPMIYIVEILKVQQDPHNSKYVNYLVKVVGQEHE